MRETPFVRYWRTTRAELDTAFLHWIPRFFPSLCETQAAAVHDALADGKRLRGCLLCLVSDALGGRREAALPRALAVECIQAASLIHDDFVDCDTERRERPAAWTKYGPRKAVLLGDLMFATALQRMTENGRAGGLAVAEVIATMANGAWQEPLEPADVERALLAEPERGQGLYPRIIHLKTGALFGTAARLGAISAGGSQRMADLAHEFGVHLGEAYQIADDLADVDGRESSATEWAVLAPAIVHFCGESELARANLPKGSTAAPESFLSETLPVLRSRMRKAMHARLGLASERARQFPDSPFGRLLETAPPEIVHLSLGELP
ncbi:Octaprenyl-diphosphate synthase / Dimethylallyltransferase / Geranyltranstransferase (farnesyldiphosphate synthase) / Geranylgeranyl pyrophosphate synthetase [Thioalkalivibrio nitratireducens DSM 14787]|uniref:Octaprenyl-diphosphate synthase / Dimethylallyltransferase / Geranyltranstransferase (Farnesyldiphosphate synthase) / Geranylgeranyl pyrophosphate synthetase n=1 Tax=Thioalkalivibrio nitratireducens (strain DSM 14787 / UNIQEM 213 / ALEN2) TaxID=1255043 RepID=L0E1I8_THIND|nr:polyprenyl synthetase family protein [Thioalkalivibrio nitratireducens]AGA34486.1 Octaprenyl-diphosphate synthase / Dimethylallyltransferase / Geranyltranstransferase (farnesyldiphosphate synthase) / Geranylgeranyl pyrophosphate synthetase [Thioalkalivibrio nitratireducens DSM 14787]